MVEVTNTQIGTTIQTEQIKNLPIPGTRLQAAGAAAPRRPATTPSAATSRISGQRGINTNITVDGVDFNNAFFGGSTGAAEGRAPLSISQESIKEFSVITNGASAEFGRSGGGFVNVITKSGTNNLHGSAFYYNQPQSLISDFATPRTAPGVRSPAPPSRPTRSKDQFGASLGGAIIKDKLFYFLSYDNQKQDITIPIAPTVLDPDIFASIRQLATPNSYAQTRNGHVTFGRLDYQVNDANRVMVRGNFTKYDGENGTSNATEPRRVSYNGVEGLDAQDRTSASTPASSAPTC